MSDAIISVVGERIVAILEEQVRYQVNLVRGVEKEVLYLSQKLGTIRSVLDDAEKRGVKEQSVKQWLKKLEDTAYEMEDILDEWHYALLYHRTQPEVCCSFFPSPSSCVCFKKLGIRHNIGIKIQNVKGKLDEILNEKDEFKFVTSLTPSDVEPKPLRAQSTSSIELAEVHGLAIHENKNEIVRRLMDASSGEVMSIVGMGGLGKTTLAQLVYNDSLVMDSFDLRIWICVSDPFDEARIARGIVNSVGRETIPQGADQLDLVMQKLKDSVSGKKFLLVLDDVWTEDYKKWEPLRINLRYGAQGSKILVTTRKENVAKMMRRGNVEVEIYRPEKLSDEECWRLLRRISLSGRSEEECGMLEDVGKRIASKCEGLPLAANVLGSLLQLKESLEEWENVWKSEIWQLKEAEVDLFPHLLLSYKELSPTLKRCFSYCAVYPKDTKINAQTLIEEWMAVGYLGSVGAEVKGRDYFNSLAMRSFFQDIERRDGGEIEWCKMHDIVHDFAMFLRGNNNDRSQQDGGADVTKCQVCGLLLGCWVQEYRSLVWGEEPPKNVCDCLTSVRVLRVECFDCPPKGMEKLIHLRRLELSYYTKLSKEDLKIICRLYFLQTLLLSFCSLENIPIEIGNLVKLRHLDLRSNGRLEELPESMCSLVELRILNLDYCVSLQQLPEGIHRLRNLQRLLIVDTPASCCLPQGLGELSGLRTLQTEFEGGNGCSKLGLLKKLNNLTGSLKLEIKYTSDLQELVKDALEAELRRKIHIHKLAIAFVMNEVQQSSSSLSSSSPLLWMKVMEALEPNQQKLNQLEIRGYMGSRLPQWISSPLSLVKNIYLFGCDELLSLPALGKLPFLEFLIMFNTKELKTVGRELLGIESSSPSPSPSNTKEVAAFPKLMELHIYEFRGWSEWEDITAEEEECSALSIMPCLKKLHIISCGGLKKLPHRLLHKASSSLRILNIVDSPLLETLYGDKDGAEWRSISQYNPKLELLC